MNKNPFGEMRSPVTKNIGGLSVTINPLRGRDGLRLAYRFGKALGPTMAALATDALKGKGQAIDAQVDLDKAVGAFFDNVTLDEFDEVTESLLQSTEIVGNRGSVDLPAFIGKPELILQVAMEVAKYQFAGFFSAWLPKIQTNLAGILARSVPSQGTTSQG